MVSPAALGVADRPFLETARARSVIFGCFYSKVQVFVRKNRKNDQKNPDDEIVCFFLVSLPCSFLPCLGVVSILSRLVSRYFVGRLDLVSLLSRVVSVSFCDLPYIYFLFFNFFDILASALIFEDKTQLFITIHSNFVHFLLF